MKLVLASVAALALAGCQSAAAPQPAAPVSVTRITSAEVDASDDAPHVGKPQQATVDDAGLRGLSKPEPRRREEDRRRPGGGFSGYK